VSDQRIQRIHRTEAQAFALQQCPGFKALAVNVKTFQEIAPVEIGCDLKSGCHFAGKAGRSWIVLVNQPKMVFHFSGVQPAGSGHIHLDGIPRDIYIGSSLPAQIGEGCA
jgi:hypothetical protein